MATKEKTKGEAKTRIIELGENARLVIDSFKNDSGSFVNFRKFYRTKKDPAWKPARQGMSIPEENMASFLKKAGFALAKIDDEAQELVSSDSKRSGVEEAKTNPKAKFKKKVKGR